MEGFTYTNIFETKALEYLIVVFFFALLIPFWMLINAKRRTRVKESAVPKFSTSVAHRLPQGIYFSRYHSWAHLERDGQAKIGPDDFLLHLTGKVRICYFKKPGEEIRKGELMASLQHQGKSLYVSAPVSGRICAINPLLEENPQLVKDDPYQNGWIYLLKPAAWKADTQSCFLAEDAEAWAKDELVRFKDFLAVTTVKYQPGNVAPILQDGGEPVEQVLAHCSQEVWQEFQKQFLT